MKFSRIKIFIPLVALVVVVAFIAAGGWGRGLTGGWSIIGRSSQEEVPLEQIIPADPVTVIEHGDVERSNASGIVVGDDGRAYVVGEIDNNPDLEFEDEAYDSSLSYRHAFLACLSDIETVEWVKYWGGSGNIRARAVALDDAGNIFVGGDFTGTKDFDPGDGVEERSTSGEDACYLSAFDRDGNFKWVRTWAGQSLNSVWAIAVDSQDRIVTAGWMEGTVDFDPGETTDTKTCDKSFISVFSNDGKYLWSETFGASVNNLTLDDFDNIYSTGWFWGVVDFDPGPGVVERSSPIARGMMGYLLKLDSAGAFQWVETWGNSMFNQGDSVDVDSEGNVYLTGGFVMADEFESEPEMTEPSLWGPQFAFVSKYDPDGTELWKQTWVGEEDTYASSVEVVEADGVYVSGMFCGTIDFNPGPGVDEVVLLPEGTFTTQYRPNEPSEMAGDAYLSKFSLDGEFQWVVTEGRQDPDSGGDLAVCPDGRLYWLGSFDNSTEMFIKLVTPEGELEE